MIDHFLLFPEKGVGACCPRVDNGRDSCRKREVRGNPQGAGLGVRLLREPVQGSSPVAHMKMNIDKARSYIQAGDINHFSRFARGKVLGHRRDLPRRNRHIHDFIDFIGGINDMTALQKKVVMRRLRFCDKLRLNCRYRF